MAEKIGCAAQALHDWVKKADVDAGKRAGVSTETAEKLKALERETENCGRPTRSRARLRPILPRRSPTARSRDDRLHHDHREAYGVEPICKVLPIAPSTYRERLAQRRDPCKLSARTRRDGALKPQIARVFAERTAGAIFVLDALEQALHDRRPPHLGGLIHHSDRGSRYVSIKYTERLVEAGVDPSVGSVGDSYDNALAETINGLYKAEVIHRRGPWRSVEAVEFAALGWIDWFNNRRLLAPIDNVPSAEAERLLRTT